MGCFIHEPVGRDIKCLKFMEKCREIRSFKFHAIDFHPYLCCCSCRVACLCCIENVFNDVAGVHLSWVLECKSNFSGFLLVVWSAWLPLVNTLKRYCAAGDRLAGSSPYYSSSLESSLATFSVPVCTSQYRILSVVPS